MDMLETAYFFGLNVKPIDTSNTKANVTVDPYTQVLMLSLKPVFLYHLLSNRAMMVFLMFIHLLLLKI
jgi:hypothetical protein